MVYAPFVDSVIRVMSEEKNLIDREAWAALKTTYAAMGVLKPEDTDDVRSIWFAVPRGPIDEFRK